MSIQRAISIRQPFVELILQGVKQEEYRSKPTNIRERVYLYASLKPFDSDEEWAKVGRQPGQLPVGLILGSVEIVDCQHDLSNDDYAYVLRDPIKFKEPLKPINQPQPVFWRPQFQKAPVAGRRVHRGGDAKSTLLAFQPDPVVVAVEWHPLDTKLATATHEEVSKEFWIARAAGDTKALKAIERALKRISVETLKLKADTLRRADKS